MLGTRRRLAITILQDASAVKMTTVDRYGFTMMVQTKEGVRGGRISFPKPADSPDAVRKGFIELMKEARA